MAWRVPGRPSHPRRSFLPLRFQPFHCLRQLRCQGFRGGVRLKRLRQLEAVSSSGNHRGEYPIGYFNVGIAGLRGDLAEQRDGSLEVWQSRGVVNGNKKVRPASSQYPAWCRWMLQVPAIVNSSCPEQRHDRSPISKAAAPHQLTAVLLGDDMPNLLLPSLFSLALCGGCAAPTGTPQSDACPPSIIATSVVPTSCGPNGWPNGGVVTNRYGEGPHVELWGPPAPNPAIGGGGGGRQ